MELIAIKADGSTDRPMAHTPQIVKDVIQATVEMYLARGYHPPWTGYLAMEGGRIVGACAFKNPPEKGPVEIAYFTFPDHEGRGVATAMARELVKIARGHAPPASVRAQTLPEPNASERVLEKVGFRRIGMVKHPEDGIVWEWELKCSQRFHT